MSNNADNEVFVYTRAREGRVPEDVVRVLVDPSVTSIPAHAFDRRSKLTDVELCEGLIEIGAQSFGCSITNINIPNSLRRIKDYAFLTSLRCPIRLHDGIESIGECAFAACIFTNFRVPSLITVVTDAILYECKSMFSVEMPKNVRVIGNYALMSCYCLRNVAFPSDAVISGTTL